MKFGDHCLIEMKRHGTENEMYLHKVITTLRSNTYVSVPVQSPATEIRHDKIIDVVACICCGVDEVKVLKFRVSDTKQHYSMRGSSIMVHRLIEAYQSGYMQSIESEPLEPTVTALEWVKRTYPEMYIQWNADRGVYDDSKTSGG